MRFVPKLHKNLERYLLKVVHTVDAHSGVLSDLDVHGHHLVTCGSHAVSRAPDRFLMVYDLRMIKVPSIYYVSTCT
jgi:hypothetical protein